MALVAHLNNVRISDPDGLEIVIDISFLDTAIVDPELREVASHSFPFYPGQSRVSIRDSVIGYGAQVKAAIAARDAFVQQFPVGTEITIPN